jgi:hypothetical protein
MTCPKQVLSYTCKIFKGLQSTNRSQCHSHGFVKPKNVVIVDLDIVALFFFGCRLWFISKCFAVAILITLKKKLQANENVQHWYEFSWE